MRPSCTQNETEGLRPSLDESTYLVEDHGVADHDDNTRYMVSHEGHGHHELDPTNSVPRTPWSPRTRSHELGLTNAMATTNWSHGLGPMNLVPRTPWPPRTRSHGLGHTNSVPRRPWPQRTRDSCLVETCNRSLSFSARGHGSEGRRSRSPSRP